MVGCFISALAFSASAADVPHNQIPLLVPQRGAWRGSTLGPQFKTDDSVDAVEVFRRAYPTTPLHLYRIFSSDVSPAVRAWVAEGNILWYNIAPTSWQSAARGDFDEDAELWAKTVKSLSPANVFVVISHEADHNLCFNTNTPCENGHPAGNTPTNYRAMWARFQSAFAEQNVTNAVWAMDYSVKIGNGTLVDQPCDDNSCHPAAAVAPLWPGDDRVDWVFYNLFEKGKGGGKRIKATYKQMQDETYHNVLSKITSASPGCASGRCDLSSKPWGVGAMGTHGAGDQAVSTDGRADFFKDLTSGLAVGEYSRLKAYLYYDSRDSWVDHTSAADVVNVAFKDYMASSAFVLNDSPMAAAVSAGNDITVSAYIV